MEVPRNKGVSMSSSRLEYRALENTNTQTRRLAYVTALISILRHRSLPEKVLLSRILRWGQAHQDSLKQYWVQTGTVGSTRRNSAGARYLDLASKLGLIASISGEYHLTQVGLALFALKNVEQVNPFVLTDAERLFYAYLLLEKDADVLLTILGRLQEQPGIGLSALQKIYQQDFVNRLIVKGRLVEDERLREQLRDRRLAIKAGWKKPVRYAEHIVPPRLNWLLDLGFLEPSAFQRHQYRLTDAGATFVEKLPRFDNAFYDVSTVWISDDFWRLTPGSLLNIQNARLWNSLSEEEQLTACAPRLKEAFGIFQHSMVPKVSLIQALFYITVKLILEDHILVSFTDLTHWLSVPRTLDGWCYQARLSPQENVSYIVLTPA